MRTSILPWIIALLAFPVAVLAATDSDSAASGDPVLEQARAATSRQDYAAAAAILRAALGKTPQSPEYHNLYAYALRKGVDCPRCGVYKSTQTLSATRDKRGRRWAHIWAGGCSSLVPRHI